ncbi:facilitated trehalose transporter Tret1-like isoform X2 [Macrobrachium rosenbergii]|uniref:facilitated trehalose transporter Tret1-like isoform X2 n=1 Tax=Macrobrachium rosenbergii TaxID=79674 RepID=UPI0034D498BE
MKMYDNSGFTFAAALAGASAGASFGYTSPAGPRLKNPISEADGKLQLDAIELNIFGSCLTLAAALGALLCGFCMSRWGRRVTLLGAAVVSIIGWLPIALGTSFPLLMFGRILNGIGTGAVTVVGPAYIGEIASPAIRGSLGACFPVMITVGNIFVFGLGSVIFSWRGLAAICATPAILCFICMFFNKESPQFLIMKARHQEARDALQYFRGKDRDISEEFGSMQAFVDNLNQKNASFRDLVLSHNMKPAVICCTVLLFCQLSGMTPMILNLWTVFEEAASGIQEDLSTIIIGVVELVFTLVSVSLVDRAGRKLLLLVSSAFMCLSLAVLGAYFYLAQQNKEWARETLGWLPLAALILYFAALNAGFFPVQYVLIGELLTPEVKGVFGSISIMVSSISGFVVSVSFEPMQHAIGSYGTYWFYALMCLLALLFSVIVVPETKGRTMQEIASHFGNPSALTSSNPGVTLS